MDTWIAELVKSTGAVVRFVILYPFSKKPLKYYFGYRESKRSRRSNIYSWLVGLITLLLILLIMKFLIYLINS
jgi:hypothetical protein